MTRPRASEILPPVWAWRLGLATAVVASVWLLYAVRGVLWAFAIAWMIAYILEPLVKAYERTRYFTRGTAVLVILLNFCMLLVLAASFVLPMVVEQMIELWNSIPMWRTRLDLYLVAHEGRIPPFVKDAVYSTLDAVEEKGPKFILAFVQNTWTSFLGSAFGLLGMLLEGLLFACVVVYLMHDYERLGQVAMDLVPPRYRKDIRAVLDELDEQMRTLLRGQFLVAIALAAIYTVGWYFSDLSFAVLLGLLTGIAYFIPYVGPAVGIAIVSIIAVLQGGDQFGRVLGVWMTFLVAVVIENVYLVPRILGRHTGLGPVAVLFAISVGGSLLGGLGILIALPAAVAVKVIGGRVIEAYKTSSLFDT